MITSSKLRVFKRYKGDGDMFARSASSEERKLVSDREWELIDLLLQDAAVINRGLGSEQRNAEAVKRLQENSENQEVIAEIRQIAEGM